MNFKKLIVSAASGGCFTVISSSLLYGQSAGGDISSQGLSFLQSIQNFLNSAKTYIGGILGVIAIIMFIILLLTKGATGQVSWVRIGVTAICAFLAVALLS
jgi:hypothetical protein